jgi:hypothetical protein
VRAAQFGCAHSRSLSLALRVFCVSPRSAGRGSSSPNMQFYVHIRRHRQLLCSLGEAGKEANGAEAAPVSY